MYPFDRQAVAKDHSFHEAWHYSREVIKLTHTVSLANMVHLRNAGGECLKLLWFPSNFHGPLLALSGYIVAP